MGEAGNLRQSHEEQTAIQQAVDELATRLQTLADRLAERTTQRRIPYGPGRVGRRLLRRQSPEGFVLDSASLRVLLPDGRLWIYSRSESTRFPTGRLFDARTDSPGFAGARSFLAGREFVFLGAVVDKYTFGWAAPTDSVSDGAAGGLCAMYGEGPAVRYVSADTAFSAIEESAAALSAD